MKQKKLPEETLAVSYVVDVVVVGGGAAGVAAAVAAARNGAKTLLLEQRGYMGGMATVSLVPAFCPYTDKKKPVIRGIGMEILEKMKQRCSTQYREWYQDQLDWVPIDPEVLKLVYDDIILESGCRIIYHTFVSQVIMNEEKDRIEGIVIVNKSGRSIVSCSYVIDATGDADVAFMAGAPFQKGGEQGELQPGTMCYLVANVDKSKFETYLREHGDTGQLHKAVRLAQERGDLPPGRKEASGIAWLSNHVAGLNFGHVFGIDGTKAEDLTRGAIEGRKTVQTQLVFLRKYVPGFEQAHLISSGEQIGIRETRRIIGDYVLLASDFLNMTSFEDDIARNAYFIDIHLTTSQDQTTIRQLPAGESHGVPYRCLLPMGITNLWVPGRAASSDRIVQSSLRVMPNCFAMGQAAGTAASMANENRIYSRQINVSELQKKLVVQGAWLGEGYMS
ncbi:FAD-dependent oxidoreductase [Paenibacillus sp. GCM10027626]|uniref:FAD-dependent oxidoreductase n=1 Tax=Paenibacillus sp. GCM10027626 TaxID=3273411 RepID=UPI00363C44E1